MNILKQALIATFIPFLAINFMATAMDNLKFNELILRPFKHENYKPTIELINYAKKVGYGDQGCINNLNEAGIKTKPNSPLIPFIVTIDPQVMQTATQQINDEKEEMITILQEEALNKQHLPDLYPNILRKMDTFNKRAQLIKKSAQKLEETPNLPWPTLIPVEHLNDSNIKINLYNDLPTNLQFNEYQTIENLKKTFEEKPTTTFYTLKSTTYKTLNNAANRTISEEERNDITWEIIEEIDLQKQHLRSNKIIKKNRLQNDALQQLPNRTLPNSNIIMVDCNYHLHGENGYSEKRTRDEALANLTPNVFGFLNDRENGYKKRKLTSEFIA
jgi:hypothetical protein